MAIPRGTQSSVLVYEQDTYDALPATPKGTKIYYTQYTPQVTQALIQPETLTGDRERSQPALDAVDLTGDIVVELSSQSAGVLFKHLIGSVTTTGTTNYTHTFTPSDLPVGLVGELDNGPDAAGAFRYEQSIGLRMNSAAFNFTPEGYATATFNTLGRDAAGAAAPLDAAPLDPGHLSLAMSRATIEENGVTLAVATNITLNIANNLEADVRSIGGGGVRIAAPESFVDVNGTLESVYDQALLTKAANSTPSDLKIVLQLGVGDGSAGNDYMEIFVGKLLFSRTSSTVTSGATRRQTLNFTGYKDGATNSISVVIKNPNPGVVKP